MSEVKCMMKYSKQARILSTCMYAYTTGTCDSYIQRAKAIYGLRKSNMSEKCYSEIRQNMVVL